MTCGLRAFLLLPLALLAACGSTPPRGPTPEAGPYEPQTQAQRSPVTVESQRESSRDSRRPGAFYKDDGPGDNPPPDLDQIPDAQPRREPLHRFANNPYQVFGQNYVPVRNPGEFRQRGMGSWYGRRYHGQKTSSGESYDMYAMTAAHPTLPIPSYVRVTHVGNGRSVVVRVNDRGPFLAGRVIDLSYAAAYRLRYVEAGSALVDVELLQTDASVQVAAAPAAAPASEPAASDTPGSPRAVPAPAPPARLPVSSDAKGIYLQLGAFSVRENAETFRARVYKELSWLNDAIAVLARDGLFRLHAGPYRSEDEARAVAERIGRELDLRAVVLIR